MVQKLTHLDARSDGSGVFQSSFLDRISPRYIFPNRMKGLKVQEDRMCS